MKPKPWFAVLAVCLVFTPSVDGRQTVEWPERWASVLQDTQSLLEAGEAKRARQTLASLLRELLEADPPSSQADSRLGQALTQLALAEAGDGKTDDAIWHWHVAQNVDRSVASTDLSRFGNLGAALSAHVLAEAPAKCAQPPGDPSSPSIRERREPKRPRAAFNAGVGGILIIQAEVDARGRPARPQVLGRRPGALVFAALEALRDWRFDVKPGVVDVPVCLVFKFG